jgi:hypothetical protein
MGVACLLLLSVSFYLHIFKVSVYRGPSFWRYLGITALFVAILSQAYVIHLEIRRQIQALSSTETRMSPLPAGVVPHNSIFHRPLGTDCPTGTGLLVGYFSEANGTTHDACHNPTGDGSIDYLNRGEGFTAHFTLVDPDQTYRNKT